MYMQSTFGHNAYRGDKMYTYTKKTSQAKKRLLFGLSAALLCSVGVLSYSLTNKDAQPEEQPVFQEEDLPVLQLPNSEETVALPFLVEASVALDYYDGTSESPSMTKFEGVYRPNQGMDYTYQEEAFDVIAMTSGTVSEVKEDEIFGSSVTIINGAITITYQSLQNITVKENDTLTQGQVIGKAGTNIYNKELGNHVHIVTEVNGVIQDPKTLFQKPLSQFS